MLILAISCSENKKTSVKQEQTMNDQLQKISALLQDSVFSLETAKNQEASYYLSQGQTPPPFLSGDADSILKKSFREEKIAINIAAFYALECGIGFLMDQKKGSLIEWLNKIVTQQLDSSEQLVLNRFANATWKAGQPFRSLKRITRDNFTSSVFLSSEEVKKDRDQIMAAAQKLLTTVSDHKDSSNESQLRRVDQLLKDRTFAIEIAKHMEAAYYKGLQQNAPPFLKPGEDTSTVMKNVLEEKIATNIAGFYALECGLSYLATADNKLPTAVLDSILNDNIDHEDKKLFERFANATWKAGQPFRSLDRITRKNFTVVDFLSSDEVEKDWVQIKAAAAVLRKSL